ncbi:glycosyltransferase family 4 protein [Vibrio artabrorum]|uniref:glycosyltransferase family 4 protein n=1 Tax=Vibrio artabrorum TaxID=446374 RepID=UPI0021C3DCC0|nr:glycosyltransferase family 4 protein [Vibrio artabrorum]
MIKVKLFSDYPYSVAFGGKEVQSIQYLNSLSSSIDVSFLDYYKKDDLKEVDILHLFGHSSSYLNLIKHVKSKYPKIKIVVSPTFFTEKCFSYRIASLIGKKLPFSNLFRDLNKISSLADKVIVNSEPEKKQFCSYFSGNADIVKVLFNGVEDEFLSKENVDVNYKDFIQSLDKFILAVGFFDERKNTNNLIKSFLKSQASLDSKLVLVGEPRFAELANKTEFDELVATHKDKVILTGLLDRKSSLLSWLYRHSEFHILPSKLETPGISNIEALMYGKNIIVGDCGPVRSYFANMATYCDSNSVESITSSIDKLLHKKEHSDEVLKKYAKDNFSMNSISRELLRVYLQLARGFNE